MGGYSFVGKEYVYQSLKLLKLGCELKFIPFRHKYIADTSDIFITVLRMKSSFILHNIYKNLVLCFISLLFDYQ